MLDMQLRTKPTLEHKMEQICSVCRKPMGIEAQHPPEVVEIARIMMDTCPCCGQCAPIKPDRAYRARARRWVARQQREAAEDTPSEE